MLRSSTRSSAGAAVASIAFIPSHFGMKWGRTAEEAKPTQARKPVVQGMDDFDQPHRSPYGVRRRAFRPGAGPHQAHRHRRGGDARAPVRHSHRYPQRCHQRHRGGTGHRQAEHRPHDRHPPHEEGGMGAQFFAVYVSATYVEGNHSANRTLQMIDTVRHDIIEKHPNEFVFATTAADIRRAHERHKIAALLGIEGGHAIEDSLRLLRDYYGLGVRYMTLTHGNSNHWADSSGDANKPNNGLSPFESGGPSAIGLRRNMPPIPMAFAAPRGGRRPPGAAAK